MHQLFSSLIAARCFYFVPCWCLFCCGDSSGKLGTAAFPEAKRCMHAHGMPLTGNITVTEFYMTSVKLGASLRRRS